MTRTWQELANDPAFALVTDLDGTLVPFAVDPADAFPSARVVTALASLAALPDTRVVVASGRPRADLEKSFGREPLITLVAEHGLHVCERGAWRETLAASSEPFDYLEAELRALTAAIDDARIERKTRGVVVHHRALTSEAREALLARAGSLIERALRAHPHLERLEGDHVIEVRLRGVSKRIAIEEARRRAHPPPSVLVLGDDITDEDMFLALGPRDLGVRVGVSARDSAAEDRIPDPEAAIERIEACLALRRARALSNS